MKCPGYCFLEGHVNANLTVSYFYVHWDESEAAVGKVAYPHPAQNACDGGVIFDESSCLCDTTLIDSSVFNSIPAREQAIAQLKVGAFDTAMFEAGEYTRLNESNDQVTVYKKRGMANYSTETVFRVLLDTDTPSYRFLKNVQSKVKVCGGTYSFRNGPTFFDIVAPEILSGHAETEAWFDYVDQHPNTPPFVCQALLKFLGHSNPTPKQSLVCSMAFKEGKFEYTADDETLTYGDGRRGSLAAVLASIALDDDALSPSTDLDPSGGGVKSPLHKLMQVMRGFNIKRTLHHRRTDGLFEQGAMNALGEFPYNTPDQVSCT